MGLTGAALHRIVGLCRHHLVMHPSPRGCRTSILIADDDPSLCVTLEMLFQGAGYATLLARCGKEAAEVIARERPDIVVLDILMPDSNGWLVLDHLPDGFDASRVIVLSALSDDSCMRRAWNYGIGAYFTKPFDTGSLLRSVEAALGSRSAGSVDSTAEELVRLRKP